MFKSSIWHRCLYFSRFIPGFNGAMLYFQLYATSSSWSLHESRVVPAQSFGGAYRSRVYVHVFIKINIYICVVSVCVGGGTEASERHLHKISILWP